jgi:hypothetical protein
MISMSFVTLIEWNLRGAITIWSLSAAALSLDCSSDAFLTIESEIGSLSSQRLGDWTVRDRHCWRSRHSRHRELIVGCAKPDRDDRFLGQLLGGCIQSWSNG